MALDIELRDPNGGFNINLGAPNAWVLVNGEWKKVSGTWVIVNGEWKQQSRVSVLVEGTWKTV